MRNHFFYRARARHVRVAATSPPPTTLQPSTSPQQQLLNHPIPPQLHTSRNLLSSTHLTAMDTPGKKAMVTELLALRQALGRIKDTDQYCDLKLLCRGREFKVHQAIVCPQSSVLAAAVSGNFKVSSFRIFHFSASPLTQDEGS